MTIFLFSQATAFALGLQGAIVLPPAVMPRNELERLVLTERDQSHGQTTAWLAKHTDTPTQQEDALLAAGFRRVRPSDVCRNYVYTRHITPSRDRGASVVLCDGEPPFVLITNEAPGPNVAPTPGAPGSSTAPSAPRS